MAIILYTICSVRYILYSILCAILIHYTLLLLLAVAMAVAGALYNILYAPYIHIYIYIYIFYTIELYGYNAMCRLYNYETLWLSYMAVWLISLLIYIVIKSLLDCYCISSTANHYCLLDLLPLLVPACASRLEH